MLKYFSFQDLGIFILPAARAWKYNRASNYILLHKQSTESSFSQLSELYIFLRKCYWFHLLVPYGPVFLSSSPKSAYLFQNNLAF